MSLEKMQNILQILGENDDLPMVEAVKKNTN